MNILILYATTEGQTEKIAAAIAGHVRAAGHELALANITEVDDVDLAAHDAAILGASVHMGRYQASLVHFIHDHVAALNNCPSAFVSVSLSAASDEADERAEIEAIAGRLFDETRWRPDHVHHAAGAFRFTRYDFFRRWAMKYIAVSKGEEVNMGEDKEYTDWAALERFVGEFLAAAAGEKGA